MATPHFFSLQSRLGLKYPPIGSTELNIGVEQGGNAILSPDFTFEFDQLNVSRLLFPLPEDITEAEDYLKRVAEEYATAANFIKSQLKPDRIQVVLGGDHSVGFPSLLAVLQREQASNVGVIMFDSHADLHLQSTSPSGNIHGMWMRMLCNGFDHPTIQEVVTEKLPYNNLRYVGNLLTEPEEDRFLAEHHIAVSSSEDLASKNIKQDLKHFVQSFPHIHVSFDIDIFQQTLVAATGTPNPNGMTKDEVFPLLEVFQHAKSLSIDLVEVNPQKPKAEQTIDLARDVLRVLLKKQLNYELQPVV